MESVAANIQLRRCNKSRRSTEHHQPAWNRSPQQETYTSTILCDAPCWGSVTPQHHRAVHGEVASPPRDGYPSRNGPGDASAAHQPRHHGRNTSHCHPRTRPKPVLKSILTQLSLVIGPLAHVEVIQATRATAYNPSLSFYCPFGERDSTPRYACFVVCLFITACPSPETLSIR